MSYFYTLAKDMYIHYGQNFATYLSKYLRPYKVYMCIYICIYVCILGNDEQSSRFTACIVLPVSVYPSILELS